ncbi:hypothetical protein EBZ37_03100 [bacterium]|nr:hypothetical protein [bacterium]
MSSTQTTTTPKSKLGRATLRALGRKKRKAKLQGNREVAKAYFEAKSKRNADKKSAFRKKKSRKK